MRIRVTTHLKEVNKYLANISARLGPGHASYINRNIIGRIIHAAITHNFYVEARRRPIKWPPLSPTYAKIKAKTNIVKAPMRQPKALGIYPTPYGNINIKTGLLFNTLGTIFRVTPNSVTYGTIVPYADEVQSGHSVKRIHVEYDRRYSGDTEGARGKIHVSYYKDLTKAIKIPPRPFNYISPREYDAMAQASADYVVAGNNRKMILIPAIEPRIAAPGGRRVYIMGRRG